MQLTRTNGDIEIADEILAATLKHIAAQGPMPYVIRIAATPQTTSETEEIADPVEIDGTIAEVTADTVTIAEVDDEAQATGGSYTFLFRDIDELEIY